MMRWLAGTSGVLLLSLIAGCGQPCFLNKEAYCGAHANLLTPRQETDPTAAAEIVTSLDAAPADVNYPDRPPRFMTLEEAIAIALESGTASGRAGIGNGAVDDTMLTFTPGTASLNNGQSDRVRVLALNPALSQANIEASLARFDAVWSSSMNWTSTDNLIQGLQSFSNGQTAAFQSSIVKAFASGGVANVSFLTNYTDLTNPPAGSFKVLNPQYNTQLILGIEQPLWRYFGDNVNELTTRNPTILGSAMPTQAAAAYNIQQGIIGGLSGSSTTPVEGILVTRLRFDQNRAEFERNVHVLILNTEVAYWKLYQAYGNLYSNEEVMRISLRAWQINKAKFDAGTIGPANYYPVLAQYEEFRGERLKSLGQVIEQERSLRGILGLPVEDGCRIVPITAPTLAPYQPDWDCALRDALNLRPELVLARDNVRYQQYQLTVQKNLLKPDLRMFANYIPVGFGTRLDGDGTFIDGTGTPRTTNALQSLASDHFNNWTVGLNMNMPIGFRFENAAVRQGRLSLVQSYYLLRDQEERAKRILAQQYQKLAEWHRRIEVTRSERIAYQESVKARFSEFAAGKTTIADFLLEAQRRLAAAQVKEYEAISEYNNSLARLEWAKGTILKFNNVHISEGQLPQCAQVRAVEHERERSKALVLRERPDLLTQPGRFTASGHFDGSGHSPTLDAGVPGPSAAPKEKGDNPDVVPEGLGQPRILPGQQSKAGGLAPGSFFTGTNAQQALWLQSPAPADGSSSWQPARSTANSLSAQANAGQVSAADLTKTGTRPGGLWRPGPGDAGFTPALGGPAPVAQTSPSTSYQN